MINLKDGTLWQWDTGRQVIITLEKNYSVDRIQYYNGLEDHAREGKIYTDKDGNLVSNIPTALLQHDKNLIVYLVTVDSVGTRTNEQYNFNVNKRAKPEDYVFTDDEVRTYTVYDERLKVIEESGATRVELNEAFEDSKEYTDKVANEVTADVLTKTNRARAFVTTEAMYEWISDPSNKGMLQVGDNLYIEEFEVPDWWVTKCLENPNNEGYYYEIKELEGKIDFTNITLDATDLVEGSDGLLTNSTDGVVIDFETYGRSNQTQYSGKNLFNVNNLPTISGLTNNNGVLTITNNYTILVATALSELADLVVGETYTLSFKTTSTNNFIYIRGAQYQWTNGTSLTITQAMLDGGINLYGVESGTVTISDIQIEKGSTATAYEPYVGGTASPNPDYEQTPKSVGDMGWFDGELLQGRYNDSGIYVIQADYICSKNPMPCNGGDMVKLLYGATMSTICFCFYDENMTVLSRPYTSNITEYEVTAPTNARYVNFHINLAGITPQTAKHICATVNDKYALIVDSVSKNFLPNTLTPQTINGLTIVVNDDKSVTINGTATARVTFPFDTIELNESSSHILSGCPVGGDRTTYNMGISYVGYDLGEGVVIPSGTTSVRPWISIESGVTVNNLTFYPMIRPVGTDATYEPYKKSRKYIPISAPLRGIGEVTDVASLSECKIDRKYIKAVFDGSSDETITLLSTNTNTALFRISLPIKAKIVQAKSLCSHFIYSMGNDDNEHFRVSSEATPVLAIWINKDRASTVAELRTWLQANPITVQYELAEPITETIELIDVDTFEGVTHISVSDEANMKIRYCTNHNDGKNLSIINDKVNKSISKVNELNAKANELDTGLGMMMNDVSHLDETVMILEEGHEHVKEQVADMLNDILFLETWDLVEDITAFGNINPGLSLPNGVTNADYMIIACDYGFTASKGVSANKYYVIDSGTSGVTPIVRFWNKEVFAFIEDVAGDVELGNKYLHFRVMLRKIIRG